MFHREAGVFKTSYAADMALYPLPIAKWAVAAFAGLFIVIVPLSLGEYYISIINLALIGAVVGIPSLRIKGIYLAIATLAAQLIIEWTINHVTWISGGVQASIQVPRPVLFGTQLKTQTQLYLFLMAFF